MSMQYVIGKPCEQCIEKDEKEHGLQYLMEEDTTKIFNSHKEAYRWIQMNIHIEDQEETMIIPLGEVLAWDGEKL